MSIAELRPGHWRRHVAFDFWSLAHCTALLAAPVAPAIYWPLAHRTAGPVAPAARGQSRSPAMCMPTLCAWLGTPRPRHHLRAVAMHKVLHNAAHPVLFVGMIVDVNHNGAHARVLVLVPPLLEEHLQTRTSTDTQACASDSTHSPTREPDSVAARPSANAHPRATKTRAQPRVSAAGERAFEF